MHSSSSKTSERSSYKRECDLFFDGKLLLKGKTPIIMAKRSVSLDGIFYVYFLLFFFSFHRFFIEPLDERVDLHCDEELMFCNATNRKNGTVFKIKSFPFGLFIMKFTNSNLLLK